MGKKGKISEYRERLDRTLASHELTDDDSLQTLIRNQLLEFSLDKNDGCSDNVIQKKTTEVSNFLDMLRSASANQHGEWKLKDDNEDYRVMYRQGPHGTPLHTLLVEGYIDGPVDACLCVGWESTLFAKWWPHITFPPFKITMCKCLQKVRIGEHISLVRVKVTWPLSAREAVVQFFLFEYLKDGLVVVLLNSISDLDNIDTSTHGFTRDGIPEATDVVRIDVVGGFATQKVNSERSYFRTIATVDLKLDFVPPSLINFISRQLIGSGFRLYQKVAAKVSDYDDEDYSKALKDPMYTRIRDVLYSIDMPSKSKEENELKNDASLTLQEHSLEDVQISYDEAEQHVQNGENARESIAENAKVTDRRTFGEIEEDDIGENRQLKDEIRANEHKVHNDDHMVDILQNTSSGTDRKTFGEIEEEESGYSTDSENNDERIDQKLTDRVSPKSPINYKANIPLSPQVEHALATLEKAISLVRERGSCSPVVLSAGIASGQNPNLQKNAETGSNRAEDGGVSPGSEVSTEASEKGRTIETTSHESRNSSGSVREVNHNKIAPASPEQYPSIASEHGQELHCSKDGSLEIPIADLTNEDDKQMIMELNGIHEEKKFTQQIKYRMCCFHVNRRKILL
ncbi:uncharacterized protein [Euphorbia lathyris]|uniref:uncharacterized protein isoform X2 n=1 Tax=Euphorbia lathyris TaxID=212925 RepID=UPI003313F844